jgi:hypothetical protein
MTPTTDDKKRLKIYYFQKIYILLSAVVVLFFKISK